MQAGLCEALVSEFGERVAILRYDVDNVLNVYKPSTYNKLVKISNLAIEIAMLSTTKFRFLFPLYENHLSELIDIEKEYNAHGTFFFRIITLPTPKILNVIRSQGDEIGYHSDRNESFETWYEDLIKMEKNLGIKVLGYTKHGMSRVRSGGMWDEKKFIAFAKLANLKYFAQGAGHPEWELPRRVKGVWVFGHHITLKHASWNDVVMYVKGRCLPMLLVHPEDLGIPGVKEKLEYVLSQRRGVEVIRVVKTLERLTAELQAH
ncbi:MAG: hypothetical protein LM590_10565 [Thermofilum sp.]|jgi:hypothetical protein|nr:hypothetical protein [Thermofilum sp.]MCC6064840.1 hypothetical protein [Thermofilum sp.]